MDGYAVEEASGAVISSKRSPLNSSDRLFLGYAQPWGWVTLARWAVGSNGREWVSSWAPG